MRNVYRFPLNFNRVQKFSDSETDFSDFGIKGEFRTEFTTTFLIFRIIYDNH